MGGVMTIVPIPIPEDLKEEFEKVFPDEPLPQAVERLMRTALSQRAAAPSKEDASALFASVRALAKEMNLTLTDDEIRALRQEGRP